MTATDTTWPFGTPPLDVTEAAFYAGRDNATKRLKDRCTDQEVAYDAMTELAALLVEGAHHEVVLASLRGLLVGAGMLDVRDLPTQRAALAQYRAPLDKVRRLRSADVATVTRLIDEAEATLAEVRAERAKRSPEDQETVDAFRARYSEAVARQVAEGQGGLLPTITWVDDPGGPVVATFPGTVPAEGGFVLTAAGTIDEVPPCTCRIQDAGTCCEVRILGRDCPRHADPIPGGAL